MKPVEKISSIIEGFKYTYVLDPVREAMAQDRAKICSGCKHAVKGRIFFMDKKDKIKEIEGMRCEICDCGLSEKLRSKKEACPYLFWNHA